MFGYVMADISALSEQERLIYRAYYCGLCRALGSRGGGLCRLTLTYDMAFLAILLSSLYSFEEFTYRKKCALHPAGSHCFIVNEAVSYCADMNLMLSYYNLMDDWHDEHNLFAGGAAAALRGTVRGLFSEYGRQCEAVEIYLKKLGEAERRGELNPDIPASCFGSLLAEIFAMREDRYAQALRKLGFCMGRFIYIADAFADLKSDLKRRRYNPLSGVINVSREEILTSLLADCADAYDELHITENTGILENILYSGVWLRADKKKRARPGRMSDGAGSV